MREQIAQAITQNQVVVICGETGSGKTTQLPQICLALKRGIDGLIGHTQPRRIAARSVASRIAEELGEQLGGAVGFKIRFQDQVCDKAYIKIMTDGILLAETQSDPELRAYDTLIIDEAHERSLNIDFILGYLKKLLPRRPDLKVIITSATIDPQRFAKHFNDAPIIEVSGRTYPVEIRYRAAQSADEDDQDRDRGQLLLDAIDELAGAGSGDILVFLPGERDIRESAELLRKHHPQGTEILPLYGRLSNEQQNRVFQPHSGRRIVLATNVAETSLTVPGIRYVVDSGLARISRYSFRTKVQRLPIEAISQASALQRAGRCGRVAAGICIRLYNEADFLQRPEFTDAEILRSNLANVILQMLILNLGDITQFPFIDAPDRRLINDGFKLLYELGAIDQNNNITALGRKLAKLPVDVRLGRMILAAAEKKCLQEVLIIASALAIPDPRFRPLDYQQQADEKHAAFVDKNSDFIAYLNLWRFYQEQRRHLSQSKLRKLCQANFLSFVRLREWSETHQQIKVIARQMNLTINSADANYHLIHSALLTGLLSNIAYHDNEKGYIGARNNKMTIFPGSGLFKQTPQWIVAAELVETQRRYARTVAKIEPAWVEPLAGHLLKKTCFEPYWKSKQGRVVVDQQVSLYGLILATHKGVDYGKINSVHAREIFIRKALVENEITSDIDFLRHNAQTKANIIAIENKLRRRDILADEKSLCDYFNKHLPKDIYALRRFEKWYQRADRKTQQQFLLIEQDYLLDPNFKYDKISYPSSLQIQEIDIKLQYLFAPGDAEDGVTAIIPVVMLNQLNEHCFDWLVPGLLEEKITALIKALPKSIRRHFVPVADTAKKCGKALTPSSTSLLEKLAAELKQIRNIELSHSVWQGIQLPEHLLMNFQITDADNRVIATGRDFKKIRDSLGNQAAESFAQLSHSAFQRQDIQAWDFGDLPEYVELDKQGLNLRGYPALVSEHNQLHLKLFDNLQDAETRHTEGVVRLFEITAVKKLRYLEKNLPDIDSLCLLYAAIGDCGSLKQDILRCATTTALLGQNQTIRSQQDFQLNADWAEKQLIGICNQICQISKEVLTLYKQITRRLADDFRGKWPESLTDIDEQLSELIYPGFLQETKITYLQSVPRYLSAINYRLDRLQQNPERDRRLVQDIEPLWTLCKLQLKKKHMAKSALFQNFRWLLEEFRVSLFAQQLKTQEKISAKRLKRIWQVIESGG